MKRILLDTNIYISAILFGGNAKEIISLARENKIKLIISEYILWEIREVLRNKFKIPDSRLNMIEHDILSLADVIRVSSYVSVIREDLADNAILSCAIDGKADILVSGDKHINSLKSYKNIRILSPREFLRRID